MNLEKLAQEIAMCKSPNVDKWLVPIVDLEGMIALIQRRESELAASRDENETIKAAQKPLADSFVSPLVTVDCDDFWARVMAYCRGIGEEGKRLVEWCDQHTARAVAAAVDDARKSSYIDPSEICIVGRAHDGKTPDIDLPIFGDGSKDGKRLFVVALPVPQPVAGELPPLDGNVVPAEWISEPCGSSVDHLSYGYGFKRGFNHCREEVLDRIAALPVQQPAAVVGQEPYAYAYEFVQPGTDGKGWEQSISREPVARQNGVRNVIPLYTADVPAAGVQGDTKPRIATEDSAQEILEAKLWEFLDLAASFPGINLDPRTWQHVMVYAPVLHNPHTGKLRDLRDVESDPKAILCTGPDEKLKAAQQPDSERDACPNCKGTGHRHEPSGEKLPCDLCETEDSGRDAALGKLVRYGFDGTLGGEFCECDKGPYWAVKDVERALAAHPAPSSGAALSNDDLLRRYAIEAADYLESVASKTTRSAVWERCTSIANDLRHSLANHFEPSNEIRRDAARYRKARQGAYRLAVGNPTPEEFDAAVDSVEPVAAHPANGAQAGEIERISKLANDGIISVTMGGKHDALARIAILAAAKKGA